ncbi:MAG: 6,7-dimethyl-8-ribityllumazine synthase [Pseudomonadales bacterium]|nr:6,7-dimethyl-8-ribityllumazine synthase [Pseudomonadales bacterium]
MSDLPRIESPGRIAILKSKWYPELVDSLSDTCERILRANGYQRIEVHTLPGSLEMPLAAADLLATDGAGDLDALICFSVILKGETAHFEMISNECMRGLGEVMQRYRRPVVVEVLPVYEMQHAVARASDDEFNKGIEAAAAAIEMIAWRRSIGA